jgi:hypothetical protein
MRPASCPEVASRKPSASIGSALIGLVLVLAFLYSVYLQTVITDRVFFSGDAGLKALMAMQFAGGGLHFDLDLPGDAWVKELWLKGWYPFSPLSVPTISGRHYIQYSFPFPLLSAPFYALFGQRGLYVLPLVSIWGLWLVFLRACRRLLLSDAATALGLATLCFSAPLTLYSAMYWEHAPAVLLAFYGITCLLRPSSDVPSSRPELLLGGALTGAAVALREELICIVGALVLVAVLKRLRPGNLLTGIRDLEWYLAASFAVIGLFLAGNALIYGHPLGAHSFAVIHENFSLYGRRHNAWLLSLKLTSYLLDTFPITYFLPLGVLLVVLLRQHPLRRSPTAFLAVIGSVYMVTVPFLLPDIRLAGDGGKQWGPRFWLVLVPIVSLAAILVLEQLYMIGKFRARAVLLLLYFALFAWGFHRNTVEGTESLSADYRDRVFPVKELLKASPEKNVVVNTTDMAQELMPALPQKNFFLADVDDQLNRFSADLVSTGQTHFYYLRYATQGAPESRAVLAGERWFYLRVSDVGRYGIYALYKAEILPKGD